MSAPGCPSRWSRRREDGRGRHPAADAGARTALAARARRLPAPRRLRASASRRSPRRSGASPAACRQLAARARAHVRDGAAALPGGRRSTGLEIADAFFAGVAQRRHGRARRDARRRCQPPCRRRRQAAGGAAADPRLRRGDEGARVAGGALRASTARRSSAPPSSTACRASSPARPTASCRPPRSRSRTARSRRST